MLAEVVRLGRRAMGDRTAYDRGRSRRCRHGHAGASPSLGLGLSVGTALPRSLELLLLVVLLRLHQVELHGPGSSQLLPQLSRQRLLARPDGVDRVFICVNSRRGRCSLGTTKIRRQRRGRRLGR